jgi:AP-2 complex subunit alpha
MHTQPPDAGLQQQILAIFKKYQFILSGSLICHLLFLQGFLTLTLYFRHESYIDVEIQQRAVEYFELSKKGAALADVLAEMPKFPEREVTM